MYKSDYFLTLLNYVGNQLGNPPLEYIVNYPQASALFLKLQATNRLITQSGYENMPETMYQAWLQSFEKEKRKRPTIIIRP